MKLYLVRHGEAAARWSQSRDPGLSERGRQQAYSICGRFRGHAPMSVVASPLLRAQETAAPLAAMWGVDVQRDDAYRELPSLVSFEERAAWLKRVMRGTWDEVDEALVNWRDDAWRAFTSIDTDAVVFSHFMVINAILSRLNGDDRLVSFEPDYISVTAFASSDDGVELIELGKALETVVL